MQQQDKASVGASRALLQVVRVSKSFGPLRALDHVDLSVDRGEFVALLGLNGAGKSTLFQILSGLYVADEGSVHVNGTNLRDNAVAALKGLGIVFQEATLDLDLPVRASLRFHGGLHGMSAQQAAARGAEEIARVGLAERFGDIARKLSGGNRRRVEIARALMHDPVILLLDEPTVGLDPTTRRSILEYVQILCKSKGLGVLWATHLIDEAEDANRVAILHKGHIIAVAPPAELMRMSNRSSLSDAFLALIDEESAGRNGQIQTRSAQ